MGALRRFFDIRQPRTCGTRPNKKESGMLNTFARALPKVKRSAGAPSLTSDQSTTAAQCGIHGGAEAAGKNARPLWRRIDRESGHARAAEATGIDDGTFGTAARDQEWRTENLVGRLRNDVSGTEILTVFIR